MENTKNKHTDLLNYQIPFSKLLVISNNGEKLGIIPLKIAIQIAKDKGLDLLLVSNNLRNPVAKILDYGKYKYDQKKEAKEHKKKQANIQNREIRLRVATGQHDLNFKAKKARNFIMDGSRVKISLKFRGREVNNQELGLKTLDIFFSYLSDISEIEKKPKLTNLFLDMYIIPKKNLKKGDSINDQNENQKSFVKKSENFKNR